MYLTYSYDTSPTLIRRLLLHIVIVINEIINRVVKCLENEIGVFPTFIFEKIIFLK